MGVLVGVGASAAANLGIALAGDGSTLSLWVLLLDEDDLEFLVSVNVPLRIPLKDALCVPSE